MPNPILMASPAVDDGLTGFTGWMADVIVQFGEAGVFFLAFIETVFPPIPSEIVLSLAGWQAQMGRMSFVLVMVAATVGIVLGSMVLYGLGAAVGEERAKVLMARIPLIERKDLDLASDWFARHGRAVVFFGRFVPIVRSLVSIPAGAQRMPVLQFMALTALGSGLWNLILVGAGYLLGTQYERIEEYTGYLDYVLLAVVVVLVALFAVRKVRSARAGAGAERDGTAG